MIARCALASSKRNLPRRRKIRAARWRPSRCEALHGLWRLAFLRQVLVETSVTSRDLDCLDALGTPYPCQDSSNGHGNSVGVGLPTHWRPTWVAAVAWASHQIAGGAAGRSAERDMPRVKRSQSRGTAAPTSRAIPRPLPGWGECPDRRRSLERLRIERAGGEYRSESKARPAARRRSALAWRGAEDPVETAARSPAGTGVSTAEGRLRAPSRRLLRQSRGQDRW
jgi:hypothetical protein